MKVLRIILILVALLVAYLLLWPTRVEPVAWSPQPAPPADSGPFALNDKLKDLQRIAEIGAIGPEGIVIGADGAIYAGYLDGRVMRFAPDGSDGKLLGNTGGRPLGLALAPDGGLYIADAHKGLLLLSGDAEPAVLTTAADGVPFAFTDDVAVARDGQGVYFSDASTRFGFGHHIEDLLEHGDTGRLLRYDPATKETKTLLKGIHFANGVALGPDDAYVLVNETAEYRVLRYWLSGEKAGQHDVFIDNLPCFPDNISFNRRDRFWLACAAPRDPLLDQLAGDVFLRKVVSRLPAALQPKPKRHGIAFGLDLDGKVVANLQYAAADAYSPVTSVREFGPWLYFGSLTEDAIGRLPLQQAIGGGGQ